MGAAASQLPPVAFLAAPRASETAASLAFHGSSPLLFFFILLSNYAALTT